MIVGVMLITSLMSFNVLSSNASHAGIVSDTNPNQLKKSISASNKEKEQAPYIVQTKTLPGSWQINTAASIDGSGNNVNRVNWGRADTPFIRLAAAEYRDGRSVLAGARRPSARQISNFAHVTNRPAPLGAAVSDMFWQWGQFLDHDITLTPEIEPEQRADISIPRGDAWFDPDRQGGRTMHFNRSSFTFDQNNQRQQRNLLTAFIDASNVYGSDTSKQKLLRSNDGTGRLRSSAGNLLPLNTSGVANAPSDSATFFIAGDFRANEQIGLIALHTVFMREHNRIAVTIGKQNPSWSGDQRYEYARALVMALMQVITYQEFLPTLLGRDALPSYRGYNSSVNPSISNEFATAAFRVGHTMLSSQLLRIDANGQPAAEGHLRLKDAFFRPQEIQQHGIESVLRGLCEQRAQKVDLQIVDDVRNLLFNNIGQGLDLASLNIQRGRDHGLASYQNTRLALGLPLRPSFAEVNSSVAVQQRLSSVYGSINDLDLWVGGLAEPAVNGGVVGETFHAILSDQFTRLRDGDRYWYQNVLPIDLQHWAESQTLTKIIQRNTLISAELSALAMRVPNAAPLGSILPLLLDD